MPRVRIGSVKAWEGCRRWSVRYYRDGCLILHTPWRCFGLFWGEGAKPVDLGPGRRK